MAPQLEPIDISNMPELLRIVEEAKKSNQPRILRWNSENVALVVPMSLRRKRSQNTGQDAEEFVLAAAGSWKGLVDPEALKEQIRSERGSNRTSVSI